jgi:tetratricopeptide (TPR) repeat protein
MSIAHEIIRTMAESWLSVFVVIVVVISVVVYFRSRKQILFESWVNMYDSTDENLGRSIADLLLFKIGHIKNVHQRSTGPIGNWNIYRDVPAFQQSLDSDVKLLASVDVGKYGSFVNAVSALLFRLLPMVFRPAQLKGSIHKYGDRLQLLATLNFYKPPNLRISANNLWEVIQEKSSPELLPEAVEELAFRIYLDLTREELFKSWEGFQAYTNGLASYISYVDLQRSTDYDKAKAGYERALSLEPNNPAISYSLGVLEYYQWKATDNEEAIGHFVKAVASSQSSLRSYAHSGLANALAQKYHRYNVHDARLLEDAVYHSERAVEIDPDLDMSNRALAFSCHQLSEYQAASPDAAVRRLSAGNRDRAIKHYVRTYELNAQNYAAHNNLANLYLEWGKRERATDKVTSENSLRQAIRECEATLAINPQYHLGYDNLANTYYELRQMEKAAENYKNALRYKPDYPEGMNDLGALCLDMAYQGRNIPEALHNHQEALAVLPETELLRKKKLCAFFGQRWLVNAAAKPKGQIEEVIWQKLKASQCTCVAEMQSEAAPARTGT